LKTTTLLILGMLCCLWPFALLAQPVIWFEGVAPQQKTQEPEIRFMILVEGESNIRSLVVDGVEQNITPQPQLALFKQITLQPGSNLIVVTATDEQGASQSKRIEVLYQPPTALSEIELFRLNGYQMELGLFQDDNPGLDLNSPHYQGVTPDAQQADQQTLLRVASLWKLWVFEGEIGLRGRHYQGNQQDLSTDELYLASEYAAELGGGAAWLLGFGYYDHNEGALDIAIRQRYLTGFRFLSLDAIGQKRITLLGAYVDKWDFASEWRTDGQDIGMIWDTKSISEDRQYEQNTVFTLGTRTQGLYSGDYNFFGADFAWAQNLTNRLKVQVGYRFEVRAFQDNAATQRGAFGVMHNDLPQELSVNAWWGFAQGWRLKPLAAYVNGNSNKIPYERRFYGVSVEKDFNP